MLSSSQAATLKFEKYSMEIACFQENKWLMTKRKPGQLKTSHKEKGGSFSISIAV